MTELYTFAVTFGLVFLLAFQSLNTNRGHRFAAAITSVGIGFAQLYVLRTIPTTDAVSVQIAYLLGGPFGAIAAMHWHPRIVGTKRRRKGGNVNCGADRP